MGVLTLKHKGRINDINLNIEKGKVYALIGRNGAGKTTLLKLISSLLFPTSGHIHCNNAIIKESTDISFAKDFNFYFSTHKIKDLILIASKIYPKWKHSLSTELVSNFELDISKDYTKASKGMQTMTSLVIALASNPEVLLLDEPYTGLDPINREFFYGFLRNHYFNSEKTVIISSHLITEIEGYFQKTIILDKGRVLINNDLQNIYEKALIIEGNKNLENLLKDHFNVLGKEQLAGHVKYFIYDNLNVKLQEQIIHQGAKIYKMDLQTFMIKLIRKGVL